MPREIIVDWTTASGIGKASVMFFDPAGAIASQRAAISVFLGAVDGSLDNSVTWTVRNTGRELDDSTGVLTGAWTASGTVTGTGNNATEPVADATQVLFQWHTGVIVGGRFLRGRTFIPGLTSSLVVNGNLNSSQAAAFQTMGETFADDAAGFGVWHRPVSGSGGLFASAESCTVWSELAVLRRRRS